MKWVAGREWGTGMGKPFSPLPRSVDISIYKIKLSNKSRKIKIYVYLVSKFYKCLIRHSTFGAIYKILD